MLGRLGSVALVVRTTTVEGRARIKWRRDSGMAFLPGMVASASRPSSSAYDFCTCWEDVVVWWRKEEHN